MGKKAKAVDDEPEEEGADWSPEERQRVTERLAASGTPLGFPDAAFGAPAMVQDAYDACVLKGPGVDMMMEAVLQAARRMDDANWERFQQVPLLNIHMEDMTVHSNLFAQTEPSWRPLLQRPKKRKQQCFFLHMGTAPLTPQLADFLAKLGWSGICVGPAKPPPGNEDLLKHVPLHPAEPQDQGKIDNLLSESGGLIRNPATFPLAFVNVVFNVNEDAAVLDPYDDDYEEKLRLRQEKEALEAQKRPSKKGVQKQPENAPLPPVPPTTLSGYGLVGLTRGERVRRRLRALKNSLAIALGRLAKDGCLVVLWPGLPLHPVLFFVAGSLRKLFQRVHVLSPEGSKTFEVYILASGFSRDRMDSKVPGMGGLEIRSFFEDTWRCDGLDDVLMWTLAPAEEDDETNVGAAGKGMIMSYTHLWKCWATKLTSLALDLGMLLGQEDGKMRGPRTRSTRTKSARAKEKAMSKARAKEGEKKEEKVEKVEKPVKEKPKVEIQAAPREEIAEEQAEDTEVPPSPASPSPEPQQEEASKEDQPVAKLEEAAETSAEKPPAEAEKPAEVAEAAEVAEKEAEKTSPEPAEAQEKPPAPDAGGAPVKPGQRRRKAPAGTKLQPFEEEEDVPRKPRRPRFELSRAMPCLASTLGAAPGHKYLEPNYEELAAKHPLIHKALEVARCGKQKHWDLEAKAVEPVLEEAEMKDANETSALKPHDKPAAADQH